MRFIHSLISVVLVGAGVAQAASSWGFDEAVISVSGKSAAGTGFKDKYVSVSPIELQLLGIWANRTM